MTLVGWGVLIIGGIIGIVIQFSLIKAAVFNAIVDAEKDLHHGSKYWESIVKNAIKEAMAEKSEKEGENL